MNETEIAAGAKEDASVGIQLEHLDAEIRRVDDSFRSLLDKLLPILPPIPKGESADICDKDVQQDSPMLEHVAQMTGRLRGLNAGICQSVNVIQI